MKEQQGLINYLTNIILRPHRETYNIEKLGTSKIVVKSYEKNISVLELMSKSPKNIPKQMQQSYCQLIQINRKDVTIKSQGINIQASIYEPQLTNLQKMHSETESNSQTLISQNNGQKYDKSPSRHQTVKYENCVVFLHANSGSRLQALQYTKYVLQYRTLCVSFDYSGSGISEGEYTTMGVNQAKNLSAVLNYIAQNYNVKKFSLWGRSMGAVTGLYYILTKYQQDYGKIQLTSCILDSPFCSLEKLILQLASKKSNLPQFVFQPLLKIIQKDIINKTGINIFKELNLEQKISQLSSQKKSLLNGIRFLGIASKEDKMISHEHTQTLCQLIISENVRNSDLMDLKTVDPNFTKDKHFFMLLDFKKELNMRGDLVYIFGDHNRPRTNEVKEKISFFIQDSFFSYQEKQTQKVNTKKSVFNPINFTKTGVSIKAKIAFNKNNTSTNANDRATKTRKNSTNNNQEQNTQREQNNRHNYNLINLKDIKLRQQKRSLSKQSNSVRNSLSKGFMSKQRKNSPQSNYQVKGLNVVSKEIQNELKFKNNSVSRNREQSNNYSKHTQTPKNLQMHPEKHQQIQNKQSNPQKELASFLGRSKDTEQTPKYKVPHKKVSIQADSLNFSNKSIQVNNSMSKRSEKSIEKQKTKNISQKPTHLPLTQPSQSYIPQQQNSTQRYYQPYVDKKNQQKQKSRIEPQSYISFNKTQNITSVNTSPFNISIDSKNNQSFQMNNSFQRKQNSQMLQTNEMSTKKQIPKTPQSKVSISEFKRGQQYQARKVGSLKKQNNFAEANSTSVSQRFIIQSFDGVQSLQSETHSSKHSINSLQFRKRAPPQTNLIKKSDISCEQSIQFGKKHQPYRSYFNKKDRFDVQHQRDINCNSNSRPNVTNSFSGNQNGQMSWKQMMINGGHKGMTQSTTFYNSNLIDNNPYEYANKNQVNQSFMYLKPPQLNYTFQEPHSKNYRDQKSNFQNRNYPQNQNSFGGIIKNMKASHEGIFNYYANQKQPQSFNNAFVQNCQQNPHMASSYNPNSNNVFYSVQNSPLYVPASKIENQKSTIQYKKKITRLLD